MDATTSQYEIHKVDISDTSVNEAMIAKGVRVYFRGSVNGGADNGRLDIAVQYYYPSNLTELSLKCAKLLDKTDVHHLTWTETGSIANPEI